MDLLEYQGKQLFAKHGIAVPSGEVASTVEEAVAAAERVGYPCAVKAQVLIGGRGKAGGIKIAADAGEAREHADAILGMDIVGPHGEGPFKVHQVWIEGGSDIASEYYASVILDRSEKKLLAMVSAKGGMDIEAVAAEDPAALVKRHIDPTVPFDAAAARPIAADAGLDEDVLDQVAEALSKLADVATNEDATLIEVNPLIVTADREVVALDAKVTIDGNALFRHEDLAEIEAGADEDPQEAMAKEKGLTYVKLDGDVGILGNGAGLCMSTLDVVAQAGGAPANFLDAGGGSKADAIVDALEVITSDPKVNAILFNIFGGITRCDEVAKGIIEASRQIDLDVPVVVRLDGTNSEQGLALLEQAAIEGLEVAGDDARRRRARRRAGEGQRLMSIVVDGDTKLAVSGLTGREGSFHGLRNRDYGTDLVAGVTPGKGGQEVGGVPVFDSIKESVEEAGANTSMIFVPARFAAPAIDEAIDSGVDTVIAITEGIPVLDMLSTYWKAKQAGVRLIGPNCPGVLSPGKANVGIIPAQFFDPGKIGVVSKSGTLTYQIGNELKQAGEGNSSIVGIGGDPIVGSDFIDILTLFEADPETELIVMVGEIGGDAEERAAEFIAAEVSKPVVAYIAGFTAPPGKQMGHAGAIISGSSGTAQAKKEALEAKGVRVGESPTETAKIAVETLRG